RKSQVNHAARLAHVEEAQPTGVHGEVHQFTDRRVEHLRPKRLEERLATLAGKIAEKEGKGRGRWCCRYGLPNLPTAPLKMSRLRPRRSRIPHDLVQRAF